MMRPWRLPEAVRAVGGAMLLVVLGLSPASLALAATGRGTDLYLFPSGMMTLSEAACREGLLDWLIALPCAVRADRRDKRSRWSARSTPR